MSDADIVAKARASLEWVDAANNRMAHFEKEEMRAVLRVLDAAESRLGNAARALDVSEMSRAAYYRDWQKADAERAAARAEHAIVSRALVDASARLTLAEKVAADMRALVAEVEGTATPLTQNNQAHGLLIRLLNRLDPARARLAAFDASHGNGE